MINSSAGKFNYCASWLDSFKFVSTVRNLVQVGKVKEYLH